ncbi:MAG: VOC family protein [Candidatus Dormibacteria bacterium]
MGSRLYAIVVDSKDPSSLARFWAQVLDCKVVYEEASEVGVARDDETYPGLIFVRVPEPKTVKNRLHIDLNPVDRDLEVERLIALGAKRVDVGQGPEVTWVVLADPEGNEFCVLRPRDGGL